MSVNAAQKKKVNCNKLKHEMVAYKRSHFYPPTTWQKSVKMNYQAPEIEWKTEQETETDGFCSYEANTATHKCSTAIGYQLMSDCRPTT